MTLEDPLPIRPLAGPFDIVYDDLPGSKSITNRALLIAALAEGTSTLTNVLFSDDTRVMIDALREVGFEIAGNETKREFAVDGQGGYWANRTQPPDVLEMHLGNAGTACRFLTAACCLGGGLYRIDGIPRLRERPIGQLVDQLRKIGGQIRYDSREGYPPITVTGTGLRGGRLRVGSTLSSQYISALLMVGPDCDEGLVLEFDGPITSRPYIEMTVRLMQRFSAEVAHSDDYSRIEVRRPKHAPMYSAQQLVIEPDASNASYFLAAAAVMPGAVVTIGGLGSDSIQGDARFAPVLQQMGARVNVADWTIDVTGPRRIRGIDVDLNDMPDMAQTLAVVAPFAEGETVIRNVGNLRVKETDRMEALRVELTKLGAKVTIDGDDIHIKPPRGNVLRNCTPDTGNGEPMSDANPVFVDTYDDHRMAMAFSVAGLRQAGLRINDPSCVNKTFPEFFDYLNRLHGAVRAG